MDIQQLFRLCGLSPQQWEEVEKSFQLKTYQPDEVVFHEGDTARRFFFIESGQAMVTKKTPGENEEPLNVLKKGQCFGEIGLVENITRTATVKAIGVLEIYELEKKEFFQLMESSPPFALLLKDLGMKRLLKDIFFYKELDEESLTEIQKLFVQETLPDKTVIFKENDSPDALYIIVKGSVRVYRRSPYGKEVTLAYLTRGDFFGEQGLIETILRSASVVTEEECKILKMKRDDFQDLLKKNAIISFNILKVMSQRMRETCKDVAMAKSVSFFKGMTIIARPDRCVSCRSCEIACAVAKSGSHKLGSAIYEKPLPVKRIHVRKVLNGSEPVIRPEHCTHCKAAPCLNSCKFVAIKRDVMSGTIAIVTDKCVGCGLCARACPFDVISMIRTKGKRKVALKCTYCSEHQDGPACVRSCPTNTLVIALSPKTDFVG
ncbi:MAG: cyclic nucleotide-binding domain-containing protein [bacterium]|nr:cyclic nucleotide-binding domain-containing protein [bacterium]